MNDAGTRTLVWCAARGIPLYGPSGASAHLRGVVRALARRGHDVRVATPLDADARGRWDDDPPVASVHAPPWRWSSGLRTVGARVDGHRLALAAFGGVVRGHPVDLVWERHDPGSAAAGRWARVRGARHVLELNAPLSLERRWPRDPRPSELRREARALRRADRVVAVSEWLADWAVRVAGCDPGRVRVVWNGVPPQGPGDRDGVRSRLGLRGPVVGFVGSMRAWQGAEMLPALLDALGPDWTGLAIGAGEAPPGPHPRLVTAGAVHERQLPDWVAAMDVAVAPYRDVPPWGCPLKVLQYRAQGVPTVCADLGPARRLVGDGGVVLDTRDVGAWAEAVRDQLGRPRVPWLRTWDDVVGEALG